ncbi:META domain-containing protein [archaeon]|nr:META domain-containing protein [archaeon]
MDEGKKVIPCKSVTLRFGSDNRVTGSGGYNNYFSSYEIGSGGKFSLGIIGSTEMYCEGAMDQEYPYFKALENVSTIAIDKNSLKLFYNGG